jgi:integrase
LRTLRHNVAALAVATGARRGELCALRWRHVDLTQDVLVIQAGIAQANGEVWETDTKLHQRRHVALVLRLGIRTTFHKLPAPLRRPDPGRAPRSTPGSSCWAEPTISVVRLR